MAKEILDITIEKSYEYSFDLDFNLPDGTDLESQYTCYFKNTDIGTKTFSVINNKFSLVLTSEDTGKIQSNLQTYEVYVRHNVTTKYEKLLSGRIHIEESL